MPTKMIIIPISNNRIPAPISSSKIIYRPAKAKIAPTKIIIKPIVNSMTGNNPQHIKNNSINPPIKPPIRSSFLYSA